LALAIEKVWPGDGNLVSAIALFATANTVLITMIAASRLLFSMSREGAIPLLFGTVLPRRRTPGAAAIVIFGISILLIPIGDVKILAELSSFSALIAFLAVNLALIILRYTSPNHRRPFRVPMRIGRMPLIPLVAIGSICLLLANFEAKIYFAVAVVLATTAVAFYLRKYWLHEHHSLSHPMTLSVSRNHDRVLK
jgi:amino acid transporter